MPLKGKILACRDSSVAAAAVLTAIAPHDKDFESLFDVTDWRSLGLHYVATTDYPRDLDEDARERALASALHYDSRNLPARVALQASLYRYSDAWYRLDEYIDWLLDTSRS